MDGTTCVFGQRSGLPVTSVFDSLEKTQDSTELKGRIDLDGCISNVDEDNAKKLCRNDPECDLLSLKKTDQSSEVADRACFYRVPDGNMVQQDRNFYGDGKSLFMDCGSVTQAFLDSIGSTGNIPTIQKTRTTENIDEFSKEQSMQFQLDPSEWRPLETAANDLSNCEITLGESRCDKNVYEPQHKSEGVFMCDEVQRVDGVDRSVGLSSRILDVTREQCYDACDKDKSCSGIAFWRTGYRSRMKTRQFYADMLSPTVQLQSTDTCDFLLPGIGDDPAVCLDKKPKNTQVRQVTVDSKGLVCEYTTKDYHKIHLERALKQAGMQSACGFQKVDNVIDGVEGRVDRFKMSGCAMIVGKVFNRNQRVGCDGGQIMTQRIVEDAVTSQFARWRFVGEGFCRNEDGDQIVLRDTTSRNNFEMIEKGAGYTVGDRLILNRGKDEDGNDLAGEDAMIIVTAVDLTGAVTDFDVEEKGTGYSQDKTYDAVGGSGTLSPVFKVSSMALPLCQKECGADSRCAALSFDEYMTYSLKNPTWGSGTCSADADVSKDDCKANGFVLNQRLLLNTGNEACGEVNTATITSKNLDDGRPLTVDEKKDRCDLTAGCVFDEEVCKPENVPFRVYSADDEGKITSVVPEDAAEARNSLKAGLTYDIRTEDGKRTLAKIKTNENISCVLYGGEKRYTDVDDGGKSFTAYQFTPYGPGVCEGADDPNDSVIAKKDGIGVFKMKRGDELLCLQRCQTTPGCNAVNYTESVDPADPDTYCTTLGKCVLKNMRTENRTFSTMTGNTIEQKGDELVVKGPGVAMEFPFVEAIDPRTCRGYGKRSDLPCTSKNDFLKFYSLRVPNCTEEQLDWTPFLGISVRPSASDACKSGFSRYMSGLTLNPATNKLQGTVCMAHDNWSKADNEASCAKICREDPSCAYFSYYPALGCQTYTKEGCTFVKQDFESGTSKGARSRRKVYAEKDDSGITASGERVCWAKELESKLEESMLITPEWRGDDRVRHSTCVLLGERNVCKKVQTLEDTNQCPAPGRPCWIGYPAGCAKIEGGSCPIVDIPAEYRGQIMRSPVAVDPESKDSLCAEFIESRTQCTNSCSTDPEAFCSYQTAELDPFALISPTEGIPIEGAMLSDMEGLMHHRGGALHPLKTCFDPLKAGKSFKCKRDYDHSRMGPMKHGFTLSDISDSVKVVGFDIGQPSDCGAATTADECAMRGGSCRWNAGTCESTVRREVAPTNVRCSYRLDDHTFIFETDSPQIKGNEGTTMALPTSGVFDVLLQSHGEENAAFQSNVADKSVQDGERCSNDSQCVSGRCDTTGDFSCFGRCLKNTATTTQTRTQNCGIVDAPKKVEDMECVDRLRVIASTIRPERHLEGYSLYPHQRPKKQPVGALCGNDAHCESGRCDVDNAFGCGGKDDGQGPRCVRKDASGTSQQQNCPYAVGNPCTTDAECASRVCADTGECHGHCLALPTSAPEYTTMARKKKEEGVDNFPESEWLESEQRYRGELRDMVVRHSMCPGTFRPLTSSDMNEMANLDVFGCEAFTAKATDAAIRCGDSKPRDEQRCALLKTEAECSDPCIWKDEVCSENSRIRTCNTFLRFENRHTNGNGGRTCYYRHTSPQTKASVSIEPWQEQDGASGDTHVQQITHPLTTGGGSVFENPTRPLEWDPKPEVPVNNKCNAKRIAFESMLKDKAAEDPFASFTEPTKTFDDICGLPTGGNACSNEGCCPNDQYAADGVFCTLLEGDRAGSMCRMADVSIPTNSKLAWIMLVERLCRITRRDWSISNGGEGYAVGDIISAGSSKFEVTAVVDMCSTKMGKLTCKNPCIWNEDEWECGTPGGESIGAVDQIRLLTGLDAPPQPFMETKCTRGKGTDCVLSASLLFKEGEAAVRALDATFIPNDTNPVTAGTEPDASGEYRIFKYANFNKIDETTRMNFVRACMDIAAPVCPQPSVDLYSGEEDAQQPEKDGNKLNGLAIAIAAFAFVGLGGLIFARTRGKVATRSIMAYVVLCAVASFFYTAM